MCKTEEGGIVPCRRGHDGTYHVDGELILAPLELLCETVSQCIPLLKAADNAHKIILSPLPRYTSGACCSDMEHAPSRAAEGFSAQLLLDLDGVRRLIKAMLFHANVKKYRVVNVARLVERGDRDGISF